MLAFGGYEYHNSNSKAGMTEQQEEAKEQYFYRVLSCFCIDDGEEGREARGKNDILLWKFALNSPWWCASQIYDTD